MAVDRERSCFDEDIKVQKQESLLPTWIFIACGAFYFVYKLMGGI